MVSVLSYTMSVKNVISNSPVPARTSPKFQVLNSSWAPSREGVLVLEEPDHALLPVCRRPATPSHRLLDRSSAECICRSLGYHGLGSVENLKSRFSVYSLPGDGAPLSVTDLHYSGCREVAYNVSQCTSTYYYAYISCTCEGGASGASGQVTPATVSCETEAQMSAPSVVQRTENNTLTKQQGNSTKQHEDSTKQQATSTETATKRQHADTDNCPTTFIYKLLFISFLTSTLVLSSVLVWVVCARLGRSSYNEFVKL